MVEQWDSSRGERFYAPLGGEIEFGERGEEALRRELFEEIGKRVAGVRPLGTLENVYEDGNGRHHELILVFDADLEEKTPERFRRVEDELECVWMPLSAFRDGEATLYPEGLLELISGASPAR